MLHAFTAGAWNPKLMKAGFAVVLADESGEDIMTAEGGLECEKAADAVRAEIVALQGVGLLLALADEGDYAVVHTLDPDVEPRMSGNLPDTAPRIAYGGQEFAAYFNDGKFLKILPSIASQLDDRDQALMRQAVVAAETKAGLRGQADGTPAADGQDDGERCPVCGGSIGLDGIDVNNNSEDGYGDMTVPCTCPHCRAELTARYDAQDGYAFLGFETA